MEKCKRCGQWFAPGVYDCRLCVRRSQFLTVLSVRGRQMRVRNFMHWWLGELEKDN